MTRGFNLGNGSQPTQPNRLSSSLQLHEVTLYESVHVYTKYKWMLRYDWYQKISTPAPTIRSDSVRVLRDGGTALYQVTQNSWRIIDEP